MIVFVCEVTKNRHYHLDGKMIRAQVVYQESTNALATAREIVGAKLRNCEFLITNYARSRRRSENDQFSVLLKTQTRLRSIRLSLSRYHKKHQILLAEARAAKLYWNAVALICHQPYWQRFYPHASDSLNVLLNTGYTFLARKCLAVIESSGFLAELGVLHGRNSVDPLVYDLMEIFRQIAVDAVVLPIFSRRPRSRVESGGRVFKKALAFLVARYEKRFWYRGRGERLERIIALEAIKLRQKILIGEIWYPYKHRWGHRKKCQ